MLCRETKTGDASAENEPTLGDGKEHKKHPGEGDHLDRGVPERPCRDALRTGDPQILARVVALAPDLFFASKIQADYESDLGR